MDSSFTEIWYFARKRQYDNDKNHRKKEQILIESDK